MKKLRLVKFSILCVVLGLALMLSSLAIWAVSAEQANKDSRNSQYLLIRCNPTFG